MDALGAVLVMQTRPRFHSEQPLPRESDGALRVGCAGKTTLADNANGPWPRLAAQRNGGMIGGTMSAADSPSEEFNRLSARVWSRKTPEKEYLVAFRSALAYDHAASWALAQAVEIIHPIHALREEARLANARWAQHHGLPLHLWADRVAATQSRDDERFLRLQRRRLELALRRQSEWPLAALQQIIHHDEPIHDFIRALWWLDEHDRLCRFDERAVLWDASGSRCEANTLRLAHPAHATLGGMDIGLLQRQVNTAQAPFRQLDREVFRSDALRQDAHGWYRPTWDKPLPLYRLHQGLRRRGEWRYTRPEDNGTVAGFYLYDERAGQTALWRLMNERDEPRYGYMVYAGYHPPDLPLRVGLMMLRGAWDRSRIDWSYSWPPNKRSYGIQPNHVCPLVEADSIFLSEVIRDVWLACTKGDVNTEGLPSTTEQDSLDR